MNETTIKRLVAKAHREGMLVELDLADGRDYSGYEVYDLIGTGDGFTITYGDYPDEQAENAVVIHYGEVTDLALI
jgi:hypothetical protein